MGVACALVAGFASIAIYAAPDQERSLVLALCRAPIRILAFVAGWRRFDQCAPRSSSPPTSRSSSTPGTGWVPPARWGEEEVRSRAACAAVPVHHAER